MYKGILPVLSGLDVTMVSVLNLKRVYSVRTEEEEEEFCIFSQTSKFHRRARVASSLIKTIRQNPSCLNSLKQT